MSIVFGILLVIPFMYMDTIPTFPEIISEFNNYLLYSNFILTLCAVAISAFVVSVLHYKKRLWTCIYLMSLFDIIIMLVDTDLCPILYDYELIWFPPFLWAMLLSSVVFAFIFKLCLFFVKYLKRKHSKDFNRYNTTKNFVLTSCVIVFLLIILFRNIPVHIDANYCNSQTTVSEIEIDDYSSHNQISINDFAVMANICDYFDNLSLNYIGTYKDLPSSDIYKLHYEAPIPVDSSENGVIKFVDENMTVLRSITIIDNKYIVDDNCKAYRIVCKRKNIISDIYKYLDCQ